MWKRLDLKGRISWLRRRRKKLEKDDENLVMIVSGYENLISYRKKYRVEMRNETDK